jgi:hypothetical protein
MAGGGVKPGFTFGETDHMGFTAIGQFGGCIDALQACVLKLLHSGWMHWWDAVDFITDETTSFVRVTIHCAPHEAKLFVTQLEQIAAATSTQLTMQNDVSLPRDGLPDLVIKTTPDRIIQLASELARESSRCVALCYNGIVHVYLNNRADITEHIQSLIQPLEAELHSLGGDWHSRWLSAQTPTINESAWLETLEKAIHEA